MKIGLFSILALTSLSIAACDKPQTEPVTEQGNSMSEVAATIPLTQPPLNREDLLLAALRAASAASTGGDDKEAQRRLDGKRFSLRLRFGCSGPVAEKDARLGWSFDGDRRLLRIRAASDINADTPLLKELPLGAYEAAKGFWIDRPWLLVAACPVFRAPAGSDATPTPPPSPVNQPTAQPTFRLGVVQLYSQDDARTHRRDGRAYEASKTLPEGAKPSAVGYDLVISGRLKRLTDRSVIACSLGEDPALPPSCVIGAEFDRVAIVDPGDETVLAEWTSI